MSSRRNGWDDFKSLLARRVPSLGYFVAQRIGETRSYLRFGKVTAYSCDIMAVDHCNLNCRDCGHASPVMSPSFSKPDEVFEDLKRIALFHKPRVVSVLGGEPLLHPELVDLLTAVRKSGIGGKLRLTTNGLLLLKMPVEVWKLIDILEISSYPETPPSEEFLVEIKRLAKEFRVQIRHFKIEAFRSNFALLGTDDQDLIRRIYRNCHIAHCWSCQFVHRGYFYKCPPALYMSKLLVNPMFDENDDGVKLAGNRNLREDIVNYLASEIPLNACRFCLGSAGKIQPHRQTDRQQWLAAHARPTEDLVDYEALDQAEIAFRPEDPLRPPFPDF